ncbi:hypothetical protein [Clostridium weizhouense]|uniref:TATA-box binding protein n=1 Tax=Clostridium weizhouense TaxID=2859781 RepID=A0ABS7AK06_9CLOT|nr:hypothetical protein [Clostridium weizhouense]MBW6408889.1 hypothetical protein [Clostridium weizhouense]
MKFKISLMLLILISFFNMGAISKQQMINKSFYEIENSMLNKSQFEENGVKIQFKTKVSIEEEYSLIKQSLISNIQGIYTEIDRNKFEILNNNFNISANLWCVDNYTYVEVILINTNSQYKIEYLKNILKSLSDKKSENIQMFLYYKGKVENISNDKFRDWLNASQYIKNIDIIKINNGYTGTGSLKDGEKVNFALSNYNTDSYVIIATPIIFTTY